MKKLLTILLVVFGLRAAAQTPIQPIGGPQTRVEIKGQSLTDSIFWCTIRDTTFIPPFRGAIDYRPADSTFYGYSDHWHPINGGIWGKIQGLLTNQTDLYDTLLARQFTLINGYGIIGFPGIAPILDTAHIRIIDSIYRIAGKDSIYIRRINGTVQAILDSIGNSGGSGSIVGARAFPPLFTTGIASGDTITFTAINVNPNLFYAGPASGGAATPTFRSIALADLPPGIPNSGLANSNINFSIGSSGTSPNWALASVNLGNTATLNLPNASSTATGPLTSTDWSTFNNKPITVNGQTGNVITKNADSIKHLPVDTTLDRNNYVLSFDSVNHKWFLAPNGSGSGSGFNAIGTFNSLSPSSNGANSSGTSIVFQSASVSNPGMVDNTIQSFSGNKTFVGFLSNTGMIAKTPVATDSAILIDAAGKLWKYSRVLSDTLFPVNGLQMVGSSQDSVGLGGRLYHNTSISAANAWLLTLDSMQAGVSRGLRINFGSDAPYDMYYRDSITGQMTRFGKGTPGQFISMLSAGGIGWVTPGGTVLSRTNITSGTGSTVPSGNTLVKFNFSSVVSAYTLTTPSSPNDQDIVVIQTGTTISAPNLEITSFTIAANAGQTLNFLITPTSLNSGANIAIRYNTTGTYWDRLY